MDDFLISSIIEVTKDKKSLNFWKKAIAALGEGIVEEELGELKHQIRLGKVRQPAQYLTSLLKKRMQSKEPQETTVDQPSKKTEEAKEQNKTFFSSNQLSLFQELQPKSNAQSLQGDSKKMPNPYSDKMIPWATFLGPEFFTLKTNKSKSDKITAKFRTQDGDTMSVSLLRGRSFQGDDERGILTAEHGRVLGAIENIWVQQGCEFTEAKGGECHCYCTVKVRELAYLLGWRDVSGETLKHLKRLIVDLKNKPYYLMLEEVEAFKLAGLKGFGFSLVADVTVYEVNFNKQEGTVLKIEFSDTYSRQLLARRAVSRSLDLITTRGDLAFLLHIYIERFVLSSGYFTKELRYIIEDLNLPPAGWHKYPAKRKTQFEKAVKELNNKTTGTGQKLIVNIVPGLSDFCLEVRLSGDPITYLPNTPNT
jgi:hypothetical protein